MVRRTHRRKKRRCSSGKVSYHSRVEAMIQLSRKQDWYDRPMRTYLCPECRQWHISTKKPRP